MSRLRSTHTKRVLARADLVCYWFEKAGRQIASGKAARAGLVATNSIRGGWNLPALQSATDGHRIFEAWSDEPWVIDGAAVRVSLICFGRAVDAWVLERRLDGQAADEIYTDLTARRGAVGVDLTGVQRLSKNVGVAFRGDEKGGPFDIAGGQAREWLRLPANPNGRTNADVLKPWTNGRDVTRRPAGKWIIDFGWTMSESDAALYQEPFQWVRERVYPIYIDTPRGSRSKPRRQHWWRHARPYPEMRQALDGLPRYIATPTVAKHRLFVWCDARICPDHQLIAIARDDDTTFGILHSRFHEVWSLRLGTWLGVGNDPRYTPTTTFQTFPFPAKASRPTSPPASYASDPRAIGYRPGSPPSRRTPQPLAQPTRMGRTGSTNPPPTTPGARSPATRRQREELKTRTLTNLYNQRPQWLANAHAALDSAVAAAYNWPAGISEEDASGGVAGDES